MKTFASGVQIERLSLISVSVAAVSVLAYWPSVHNSFISDDYTMLPFVRQASHHPGILLEVPSEIFRAASYAYFWLCLQAFGADSELFYWTGIALHTLVSLLVGRLVFVLARSTSAAWAAAMFFAAYERHQEAVMWISAVNDTLLTLFSLLFLLAWEESLSNPEGRLAYGLSLGVFLLALFSKEPSVALVPLAVLLMARRKFTSREILERTLPLLGMLAAYASLWLWAADRNFFVTEGYYALSWHFFPVYFRGLWRVVSPSLLFLVPFLWLAYRRSRALEGLRILRSGSVLIFFGIVVLTIVPYAFLTYLDHIPSRNTYLPSVGLAALVGLFFKHLYDLTATLRGRTLCVAFLAVVVSANVAYVRLKKEPQFRERAAPTRELIASLNGPESRDIGKAPIHVCSFPLHVSIGHSAVEEFTRFGRGRVAFLDHCDGSLVGHALYWTPGESVYVRRIVEAEAAARN